MCVKETMCVADEEVADEEDFFGGDTHCKCGEEKGGCARDPL
jgi:hypothetical protein